MQTCLNINVVNTDIYETYMYVYGYHNSTNKCTDHKLKIVYKT